MNNLAIIDILRNEVVTVPSKRNPDEEQVNIFPPRKIINCLYEWRFQNYDNLFSLICLGMGDNTPDPDTVRNGRMVIVTCRISQINTRLIRTKTIHRYHTKHPVFAITKLDERRLLYSWGTYLCMIHFDPKAEEGGHRYGHHEP